MSKQKKTSYIKNLILEIPAILIAVLLAVSLSQWKDDKNEKEKEKVIVSYVTGEITKNLRRISVIDSISQGLLKDINASIEAYKNEESDSIPHRMATVEISKAAWEMTKVSNVISNINPEIITNMAVVYQEQERIHYIYTSLDDYYINRAPLMSDLDNALFQKAYLEKLIILYADLSRKYEKYLELIKTTEYYIAPTE